MIAELGVQKVAVIDDDDDEAALMISELGSWQVEAIPIDVDGVSLDEVITRIAANADAAIFDHWLSSGKHVEFTGAEAVARLFERDFPAILVTMFPHDVDAIRQWRSRVPVLTTRETALETFDEAIASCIAELRGEIEPMRQAWPTTLSIERVRGGGSGPDRIVDVLISGWRPDETIGIPVSVLPNAWWEATEELLAGSVFNAAANVGATHARDLFVVDVQNPPELTALTKALEEQPRPDFGDQYE